jgi:hypothetical protein
MMEDYFKSLSLELTSLKNRVRHFIKDKHWLSDGEWKESVLRASLSRCLPADIKIGRGFIYTPDKLSTQIDILLYASDAPVLFRDTDFVIVQPQAVLGVIEVKTKLDRSGIRKAVSRTKEIGQLIPSVNRPFLSVFSYDCDVGDVSNVLEDLQSEVTDKSRIIDFMCLGESRLIKYWHNDPAYPQDPSLHDKWHSYKLEKMAYGYFIHNVLQALSPKYIEKNQDTWFPTQTKEIHKEAEIRRVHSYLETVPITLRMEQIAAEND